jgi:hypothetical protein
VISHVGALRAGDGRPPVGIKLVIEGQEEVGGGALTTYPLEHPEAFACDAMVIGDMGSVRPGVPTLTVALRGMAMAEIEVRTLAGAKHSGQFGGAAPDALLVVLRALASLHDDNGDVALEGLRREAWTGESYSAAEFRELAEVLDGLPLQGTGDLGSRVWSGPAITVTGIDVPSVDNALNAVSARKLSGFASTCSVSPPPPTSSCPSITSFTPTGGRPPNTRKAAAWAITLDFESAAPRPKIAPSRSVAVNGSELHSDSSPGGTTS